MLAVDFWGVIFFNALSFDNEPIILKYGLSWRCDWHLLFPRKN